MYKHRFGITRISSHLLWHAMNPVLIASMLVVAAGSRAAVAATENSHGYDALLGFSPDEENVKPLLQMSDTQLASVTGGEISNPMQNFGLVSAEHLGERIAQVLNQVIIRGQSMPPVSKSGEEESGSNVSAHQIRTTVSQPNQNQLVVQQLNSPHQVFTVTVDPQHDGTMRVVAQEGNRTIVIVIPFSISPQMLLNAVPFPATGAVRDEVVQTIHEISGSVLGNPPTVLRTQR